MNSGSEQKLSMDELLEKNRPAQVVQTMPQPPAQEPTPPPEVHPTKAEWEDLLSDLYTLADERTGWEAEREAFFSAQHQSAQTTTAAPGWAYMGSVADGNGNVASAVVGLGYRLEQSQSVAPVMDSTTMLPHTDRKTLRKKQQKKIAQGHAEDDHEEEQTWQQTM